ncbi:LOW QUALITY PROTEIN: ubiquinol-cytochrome c reductase complex assembly factor 4 [Oryctolagus cuniculus]|uniref:LOW QUALITY PROTEIN: ubiquinol-cytochrome c reductase complex assembly factor 4 n=1 Tax=Oryctolagus cuniculus TaxID=9986 RepID=UPI003879FDFE
MNNLGAHRQPAARAVRRLLGGAGRSLHSPPGLRARGSPIGEGEDEPGRPIQFSCSKASPARWTVAQSMGWQQQRPWWKVLPVSLSLMLLVTWCFLRPKSSADLWLQRVLDGEGPGHGGGAEAPGARAQRGSRGGLTQTVVNKQPDLVEKKKERKKMNNLIKKYAKDLKRHLTKLHIFIYWGWHCGTVSYTNVCNNGIPYWSTGSGPGCSTSDSDLP